MFSYRHSGRISCHIYFKTFAVISVTVCLSVAFGWNFCCQFKDGMVMLIYAREYLANHL